MEIAGRQVVAGSNGAFGNAAGGSNAAAGAAAQQVVNVPAAAGAQAQTVVRASPSQQMVQPVALPSGLATGTIVSPAGVLSAAPSPITAVGAAVTGLAVSSMSTVSPLLAASSSTSTSTAAKSDGGFTFKITWLIPIFVVLGILLLMTIFGKCWGMASNRRDAEEAERRRQHRNSMITLNGGDPQKLTTSEISYETHDYDMFMGKGKPEMSQVAGGQTPSLAYGAGADGDRRRSRQLPNGQTNGRWGATKQRALGSSDLGKFTSFPNEQQDRRGSRDSLDEGAPRGGRASQQRAYSPISNERPQQTLFGKAAEPINGVARAVASGPSAVAAWLRQSSVDNIADEDARLLDPSGSPVKVTKQLPAFHQHRASQTKLPEVPVVLGSSGNFIDSPLSSPQKKALPLPLQRGTSTRSEAPTPPEKPDRNHEFGTVSARSSPSLYTCASWSKNTVGTASPSFGENGEVATLGSAWRLTRENTIANAERPDVAAQQPRSALSRVKTTAQNKSRTRSVRIRDTVDGIDESSEVSRPSTSRKQQPAEDVFGTVTISRQGTQSTASYSSSSARNSVATSATTPRSSSPEKRTVHSGAYNAATPTMNSFASGLMSMMSEMAASPMPAAAGLGIPNDDEAVSSVVSDDGPRRQGTCLKVGGRWDEPTKSPSPTRNRPLPSPARPSALQVASPVQVAARSLPAAPSPARNRAEDLFMVAPKTAYNESTPPKKLQRAGSTTPSKYMVGGQSSGTPASRTYSVRMANRETPQDPDSALKRAATRKASYKSSQSPSHQRRASGRALLDDSPARPVAV